MKVTFWKLVGTLTVCVLVSSSALRAQDETQIEEQGDVAYAVQEEPAGSGNGVLSWLFPGQRVSYEYVNAEEIQQVAAEEIVTAGVDGNVAYSDCCGTCGSYGNCGCGACSCGGSGCNACCTGGWFLQADAIMAAYHRTDGMRVGNGSGEVTNIGWDLTPRIAIGYQRACGMGVRIRWWEYNHNQESQNQAPGEFIKVDTYNFDFEFYDTIQVGCNWSLELSGGFRRTEFDEYLVDMWPYPQENRISNNSAEGKGILIGIEGRRTVGCWGAFYGGLKTSVLMGDKHATNLFTGTNGSSMTGETFNDSVFGQVELSVGIEKQCCFACGTGFVRVGAEMQDWYNFTNSFQGTSENSFDSHSDVGFAMFMASVGFVQ